MPIFFVKITYYCSQSACTCAYNALRVFVSLIIPSNHVKPEQDLKQKFFWGKNTRILGLCFASHTRSALCASAFHVGYSLARTQCTSCKCISYGVSLEGETLSHLFDIFTWIGATPQLFLEHKMRTQRLPPNETPEGISRTQKPEPK